MQGNADSKSSSVGAATRVARTRLCLRSAARAGEPVAAPSGAGNRIEPARVVVPVWLEGGSRPGTAGPCPYRGTGIPEPDTAERLRGGFRQRGPGRLAVAARQATPPDVGTVARDLRAIARGAERPLR